MAKKFAEINGFHRAFPLKSDTITYDITSYKSDEINKNTICFVTADENDEGRNVSTIKIQQDDRFIITQGNVYASPSANTKKTSYFYIGEVGLTGETVSFEDGQDYSDLINNNLADGNVVSEEVTVAFKRYDGLNLYTKNNPLNVKPGRLFVTRIGEQTQFSENLSRIIEFIIIAPISGFNLPDYASIEDAFDIYGPMHTNWKEAGFISGFHPDSSAGFSVQEYSVVQVNGEMCLVWYIKSNNEYKMLTGDFEFNISVNTTL